ncbi:hypothetical protein N9I05_03195 [Pseudomonadales bacterium]|nr:hypothetical protein [Pseudomonadales bacterium]
MKTFKQHALHSRLLWAFYLTQTDGIATAMKKRSPIHDIFCNESKPTPLINPE